MTSRLRSLFIKFFGKILKIRKLDAVEQLPQFPFGSLPLATRDEYIALHKKACAKRSIEIDAYEKKTGFKINKKWIDELALHTQVVKKKSEVNYLHGHLLYSALCQRITNLAVGEKLTAFETGTARGFSTLCMAKALMDTATFGKIVTLDILPHDVAIFWNCIDDLEGAKTRRELLKPWDEYLNFAIFLQLDASKDLQRVGLSRIHFAFIDASHDKDSVIKEFDFIQKRQQQGDMILFDDVSSKFPEVQEALCFIRKNSNYEILTFDENDERGYALATRR